MIRRAVPLNCFPTSVSTLRTAVRSSSTTPNPHKIQILDAVMNVVSDRYKIPMNGPDMRAGTVAAYRSLGVVLQQYVTFLEKEGPSSPAAIIAAATAKMSSLQTQKNDEPSSQSSSISAAFRAGLKAGKEAGSKVGTVNGIDIGKKRLEEGPLPSSLVPPSSSSTHLDLNERIRLASYTSLISFLVRTLFSKNTAPLETTRIVEELKRNNLEDIHLKNPENQSEKASPDSTVNASLIVERHFPITGHFRNLLQNYYHMPTQKMVPVLGASGKGLGKEFRDFFANSGRVSLRFGKIASALYPARTLPGAVGGDIGTVPELTNVFELAHPADHILKASIKTIKVDGSVIEANADDMISTSPEGHEKLERSITELLSHEVNAVLDALDTSRKSSQTSTQSLIANESDAKALQHPLVSVDVLMDIVVPPRRFVSEFDFYDERIYGASNDGERMSVAKLLALNSATTITRFLDSVYRMFSGRPIKILVANNKSIELLARQVGATDSISPSQVTDAATGKLIQKYPYETKIVTMVYSFADKEWAIDNIQNVF